MSCVGYRRPWQQQLEVNLLAINHRHHTQVSSRVSLKHTPEMPSQAGDPETTSAKHSVEVAEGNSMVVEKFIQDLDTNDDLPPPPKLTPEEEKRLYRKIDWRLMPILIVMYLCGFLDRGNIGNAKLQGLTTQLNLTGNKYNVALAMYFVPYCLVECPASLVTKKFRPSRWLPAMTIAWGVIMSLMGIVKNYPQLVGARVALGAAEAGLFPGVAWYLSMWYPRHKLQFRIGVFWGGATIAGAFSGILAYGISFMSGTGGRLGWSWIFILEGGLTVVVGIVSIFIIIDFPTTAKFLTPEERIYVLWRKKYDNSLVGEEEAFAFRHVWAAMSDWQTWMHILIYMSIIGPLYGISFFLPSIINGFGFSPASSQLLTVPPYVFGTIVTLLFAVLSDKVQMRAPFILAGHIMCLIGFSIQISNAPSGVKYFGTFFCVAGSYSAFPGVISWLANNMAGQYKRGTAIALHIGFGNFAGSISSVLYRTQDAPRYILGDALELMFVGMGMITLTIAVITYKRINAKRDAEEKDRLEKGVKYTAKQLREMGDRAPDFRYTL